MIDKSARESPSTWLSLHKKITTAIKILENATVYKLYSILFQQYKEDNEALGQKIWYRTLLMILEVGSAFYIFWLEFVFETYWPFLYHISKKRHKKNSSFGPLGSLTRKNQILDLWILMTKKLCYNFQIWTKNAGLARCN